MRNNFEIRELQEKEGQQIRVGVDVIERKKNDDDDSYTFVMSDEVQDRHGTIVKLGGANLEHYKANPIIAWMHETRKGLFDAQSYDPDNVIGYGEPFYEDGKLKTRIKFEPAELNERADKIRRKIDFGSIRAGSIGFILDKGSWGDEKRGEDPDIYYIRDWTLLEYSIVTVPSNPNATVERDGWDMSIGAPEKKEIKEDKLINSTPRLNRAKIKLKLQKWQQF